MENADWPSLPLDAWKDTYATLHMWSQIVGKIRLKLTPYVNHWWEVALYVSTRGLRTSPIPYGNRIFELEFDFLAHILFIRTSDGQYRAMALAPRTVADFYQELMGHLRSLKIEVQIDLVPKEVPEPIPCDQDTVHASYDREYAQRFWRALIQVDRVFNRFRSGFIGKCSPVHFFWGSFDLAVTRFSGRRAPMRPDADHITRLAYSHEVSSVGFWPGSGNILEPAFYSYMSPEPDGFAESRAIPSSTFYNPPTHGFILRYEDVRRSRDPNRMLLEFCQSTYEAGANLAHWNREELERRIPALSRAA